MAVTALVAAVVQVPVGEVLDADLDQGALLVRRVPGVAMDTPAARTRLAGHGSEVPVAEDLGALLRDLAGVPVAAAVEAGVGEADLDGWARQLRRDVDVLSGALEPHDGARLTGLLRWPAPVERISFSHNDLGDEHLFVDETGRLSGMIDLSDACLGDPARDLALILFDLGPRIAGRVAVHAGLDDEDSWSAARWFAARAGVAGLVQRLHRTGELHQPTLQRLRTVLAEA